MAKAGYVQRLKEAGLGSVCVSLHGRNYFDDPKIHEKKLRAIATLVDAGIPIHHVSANIRKWEELPELLADGLSLTHGIAGHYRIRSPTRWGRSEGEPVFLSTLVKTAIRSLEASGHEVILLKSDNTSYHVNLLVDGKRIIRLIRFCTSLEEIDFDQLDGPPWAIFDRASGEVNLVKSIILAELRKMGAQIG
jgi:hypothetical protein